MPAYTLPRTGDKPYQYNSEDYEVLADCDSKTPKSQRWHRVRVFSSRSLAFPPLVAISFESTFEPKHDEVWECQSLAHVFLKIRTHDPLQYVIGLPERTDKELAQNGGRNRQLRADLKGRWDLLVSTVAEKLGLSSHQPPGRPTIDPEGGPSELVGVRFAESDLKDIDELRGKESRQDYIRKAIRFFNQAKKL